MSAKSTEPTAKALYYVAPGRAEIRPEKLSILPPGEIRVHALFGAFSRGTEALILAGRVPVSEYKRMRAPFMGGDFPFPVKYGYATAGRVEDGPAELRGRAVFALHPHQTLFDIPAAAAALLPDTIPLPRAVLAANMETALNAVWDATPAPGARIAVVGAGVVGALVGYLCGRIAGAAVTLVDINPERAEVARHLGVGFAMPEAAPTECDIVFHASATAAGLTTALNLAGEEAAITELSWYGDARIPVPLGGAFHSRRLRLNSSQVGMIAPSHRAEWTHARRLAEAVKLLEDPQLDVLLAPPIPFAELPARISDILDPKRGGLCPLIAYE